MNDETGPETSPPAALPAAHPAALAAVPPPRHTALEDAQGVFVGVVCAALGTALLAHMGLLIGSTAGLALIVSYASGIGFGPVFFLVNLPFYGLGVARMGWPFTLKTLAAVSLLSLLVELQPGMLEFGAVQPVAGAVLGGTLVGVGLLVLFRHRASLGGVGILAYWVQERFGWRAGWVQLGVDLLVLALAPLVLGLPAIALSVLAAVTMNLFLAINHRPDRYIAK